MAEPQHTPKPDKSRSAISHIAEQVSDLAEAKAMLVTGQVAQTTYHLEQGVGKFPNHCDLWHALGHTHRDRGHTEEAIKAYSKAIELAYRYHAPIHFECSAQFLQRALMHLAMGEEKKGQADLDAAIFQDHDNKAALMIKTEGWRRGMQLPAYTRNLMTETHWHKETGRVMSEMHQLQPHQQQHDKAIYFFRHDNMRAAFVIIGELLKLRPDYAMAWHHRALMHLHINETRQAYDDLNKAIETAHHWHEAYHHDAAMHHFHRGLLYAQTDQPEMAVMDFSKALELDKHFAPVYAERAQLHAQQKQYPTALADMDAALAIDPRPEWQELRKEWAKIIGG